MKRKTTLSSIFVNMYIVHMYYDYCKKIKYDGQLCGFKPWEIASSIKKIIKGGITKTPNITWTQF